MPAGYGAECISFPYCNSSSSFTLAGRFTSTGTFLSFATFTLFRELDILIFEVIFCEYKCLIMNLSGVKVYRISRVYRVTEVALFKMKVRPCASTGTST